MRKKILGLSMLICFFQVNAQVADYDGNIYDTVVLGTQVWLKQNLKSLHYSDGTAIPDVVGYNNSDSMANIYGRLYTWNAAMRNTTVQMAQGVCPARWHVPSHSEWSVLENFLGGAAVAGGKMKDTTAGMWNAPNTGATNSSGLSILPAGEYDAYYTPNKFQLLNEYAVYWTSTQVNGTKAKERFIAHNSAACSIYDWYKVMKYSIRCVKSSTIGIDGKAVLDDFKIYPNPVKTHLFLSGNNEFANAIMNIFDMQGRLVLSKTLKENESSIELVQLPEGLYMLQISKNAEMIATKFIKE